MVQLEYSVEKPLNREPEMGKLVSSFLTQDGYDRNHGPIPHLSASTHRVSIYGLTTTHLSLSIPDLQSLPQHTLTCALQCAGNRRHTMRTNLKEVCGIDWFDGAVMNCQWRGPLLHDVLSRAGLTVHPSDWPAAHVAFDCFQTPCQDDKYYGASIPLARAMDRDARVLLALEMNGRPLAPNRGGPVRVVAPGVAGARSVKWLDRITVQMRESENYYQQSDYKILPPEADCAEKAKLWWPRVEALLDMPVNSVIGVPQSGAKVRADADGEIEVRGYALPCGSDGPIVRVEVSVDGGGTWKDAELLDEGREAQGMELKWAWRLWRARVRIGKGKGKKVLSRATDRRGNTQSACPEWNFRGVAYNGYGEATALEVV